MPLRPIAPGARKEEVPLTGSSQAKQALGMPMPAPCSDPKALVMNDGAWYFTDDPAVMGSYADVVFGDGVDDLCRKLRERLGLNHERLEYVRVWPDALGRPKNATVLGRPEFKTYGDEGDAEILVELLKQHESIQVNYIATDSARPFDDLRADAASLGACISSHDYCARLDKSAARGLLERLTTKRPKAFTVNDIYEAVNALSALLRPSCTVKTRFKLDWAREPGPQSAVANLVTLAIIFERVHGLGSYRAVPEFAKLVDRWRERKANPPVWVQKDKEFAEWMEREARARRRKGQPVPEMPSRADLMRRLGLKQSSLRSRGEQ